MIAGSATLSNCDGPQADAAHLELWVAHASKRTHLNDAVQGVTAKVIVGPHVAVCSSSASATCEGEGSAAQHFFSDTVSRPSAPRERAQLIKRGNVCDGNSPSEETSSDPSEKSVRVAGACKPM